MHPALPPARALAPAFVALAVAACAGGPSVQTGAGANPSAARGQLVAAAADGPVPLEVGRVPPVFRGGPTEVARIASQAGEWLGARFVPIPYGASPAQRRLVFRFDEPAGSPAEICAGRAAPGRLQTSPPRLRAVFCEGTRPVADVTGVAEGPDLQAADRLVTASLDRLFPGRTGNGSYGFPGVSLGVGVGSGGDWGLGGGLHF